MRRRHDHREDTWRWQPRPRPVATATEGADTDGDAVNSAADNGHRAEYTTGQLTWRLGELGFTTPRRTRQQRRRSSMNSYLTFPTAATTGVSGLRWDDTAGSYRCPTCNQTPRTLAFGPVEALACSDCATYWLAPTAAGRRDLEGVEDVYRAAGCLDSDLADSGSNTALDGAVSAVARAA